MMRQDKLGQDRHRKDSKGSRNRSQEGIHRIMEDYCRIDLVLRFVSTNYSH